ncbi:hypothetical protein chiPu_0024522 [Chiloscyllium punctatum]|uniref:Uncharacterized protein n=1 Tax=Chiloscyllium punctatum TaxID=137246 RepID=A0A401TEC6_CHIPU|nr:hypothetical protein [Chiloscyllium punctatum]
MLDVIGQAFDANTLKEKRIRGPKADIMIYDLLKIALKIQALSSSLYKQEKRELPHDKGDAEWQAKD